MWTRKQAVPADPEIQADAANGPPTELVIRLKERHLRWTSLEEASNYIIDNRLRGYCVVRFDFSRVTELIGPWGIHFAMLIWLEHRIGVPVRISGLSGQPADMARLFCHSPNVRALVTGPAAGLGRDEAGRQAA